MAEMEEAQPRVWEILMEMERCSGKAKGEDLGAVALVLALAKAFERVSLPVVCAWATHFSFQGFFYGCCAGILSISGVCSSKDAWRSRSRPSRPLYQGQSGVAWLCVLQDALSELTKIYPP